MSVYKRGDVWWYRIHFAGVEYRESTKTDSKTLAKEAEQRRRRELESGYNGLEDRRGQRMRRFSQLAEEYLVDYRLRHKAVSFAEQAVKNLLRHLGKQLIHAFSESVVIGYQSARLKEGAAPKTINEEVGFLLRILGEMGDPLRLRLRRARKLKLAVREHIGRALTLEERDALLAAAKKRRSPHIYPAILLSIDAGLRDSEIRHLQWGLVNFDQRLVTVGKSKTQAGQGRTVPMSPALYDALVEHARWFTGKFGAAAPEHYCFPYGKPQPTDPTRPVLTLKTSWNVVRKEAGVSARFHDGRHTFCTELAEAGASDEVIRSTVGHVSTHMLRHYSHVRTEAKRNAIAAVEAIRAERRERAKQEAENKNFGEDRTLGHTTGFFQ